MTYYISTLGSSGNTGTSSSSPWDISKFTSFAFLAGDIILFRRGDTFTGSFVFAHSGTIGNPIILDAYGAGNNPTFDGGNSTSNVLFFTNQSFITINNLVIQNSLGLGIAIVNGHDFNMHNLYITKTASGITAISCTGNIVVDSCYMKNVVGPYPKGEFVQFNNVSGAGNKVINNKFQNVLGQSTPEDGISLYESSGTPTSPILVDNNWIRGDGGVTNSSCGITTGDSGGNYQTASNNLIVNHGAVGIDITGGSHNSLINNKVYSAQSTHTNVGLYVWSQKGDAPTVPTITNATVSGNRVNWLNKSGVKNSKYLAAGETTPTGWNTNTWDDVTIDDTILPNPLWTGTPWNLVLPTLVFNAIAAVVYGVSDFVPGATSSNPITYTSSNSSVATIIAGRIHVIGVGTSTITANDGVSSIPQTLTVNKASLTITANDFTIAKGDSIPNFTINYSGFVNGEDHTALTVQPTATTAATSDSPAGLYAIVPSGATSSNYNISYVNGNLFILSPDNISIRGVTIIFKP